MAVFRAFKPEAMNKIAQSMGYSGDMREFESFIEQDPARKARMNQFTNAAMQMAKGGVVKMQQGGSLVPTLSPTFGQQLGGRPNSIPLSDIPPRGQEGGMLPGMEASVPPMYGPEGTYSLTGGPDPRGISNYIPPRGQEGGGFFNAAPAVVVYDPNTGQQYGSPQQANQAGVSNPVMSLPPGVSPIPMQSSPKMNDPRGGLMGADGTMGTVNTAPQTFNYTYEQAFTRNSQRDVKSPAEQAAISAALARGPFTDQPPLALTGAQPGGAMPVMDDPRGPRVPSFGGVLNPLMGPANKAVPVPKMQDVNKMFDTSVVDPNTGFMQRLRLDGTVDTGNFGNYQYYADKAQKDYEKNMSEYERQRQALGDNFTYGQLQQFKQQEGIQNLKTQHANVDTGFFDSPEFKNIKGGPAGQAFTYSAYFGMHPNTSIGQRDQAYEAYLRRTNQTNKLKGGSEFIQADGNVSKTGVPDRNFILESDPTAQQAPAPAAPTASPASIGDVTAQRLYNPGLPQGGVTTAAMTPTGPGQEVQQGTGALTGAVAVPTAMAQTAMASPQQETQANLMTATTAAPAINAALQTVQAAQVQPDDVRAQVAAAQQTASSVGNLTAAQGNATLIDNPVQRNIQSGELISGVANAQVASTFTEQVQAATATPSTQATVQGQLAQLTANFDASNPPAWAAGALRGVQAQMAARGLGASSIAGQAMVQAALESAIPIAQADASVTAQFETQNLSNRQQRAMLSAQQRAQFIGQEFDQAFQARVQNAAKISDIANQNFTAEQQVQLENSRAANTMNLNNLSNKQALVIAEASALTQMDLSNLNNRQQSAVQNASNFLQRDMANLSNSQQTELFNAQQRVQSLFTDAAAANAASQFNASSQNQVDQFFANLGLQTSQFNATQSNAQSQFNAGQANTVERFNAEMNNQRDQFNAQNQLVIAQSNAQWRRQLATADTATVNRVNEINAQNVLDISKTAYDNLWQYYGDTMEWAWKSAENEIDRISALAIAELDAKTQEAVSARQAASSSGKAIGSLIGTLGSAWIGGL